MNAKQEDLWMKWYEEIPSDVEIQEDDSDISDALSEHSVHKTDTEQSADEEESDHQLDLQRTSTEPELVATVPRAPQFSGKDGTLWLKHKPHCRPGKTRAQNLITKLPGVKGAAGNKIEIIDCWQLYFSLDVLGNIVQFTNQKLNLIRTCYGRPRDCLPTDLEEIMAFLGLLYLAGVKRGQHLNTHEFWSQDGTVLYPTQM